VYTEYCIKYAFIENGRCLWIGLLTETSKLLNRIVNHRFQYIIIVVTILLFRPRRFRKLINHRSSFCLYTRRRIYVYIVYSIAPVVVPVWSPWNLPQCTSNVCKRQNKNTSHRETLYPPYPPSPSHTGLRVLIHIYCINRPQHGNEFKREKHRREGCN